MNFFLKADWKNAWFIQVQRFKLSALREDLCYLFTHIAIGTFLSALYYKFITKKLPDDTIELLVNEIPVLIFVILLLLIYKLVPNVEKFFNLQFNILKMCKILYSRFIEALLYMVGLNLYISLVNINDYSGLFARIIISYFILLLAENIKDNDNNLVIHCVTFEVK